MKMITGLGNPGNAYWDTRHNVGFGIADALVDQYGLGERSMTGSYEMAECRFKGQTFMVMKPMTFMNRSGSAVTKALAHTQISLDDMIVCYDDLNLPLGELRMKHGGSAGGHNGIQDIIDQTGTREFPRLRFGIGNDFPRGMQVEYVLSRFSSSEKEIVDEAKALAVEALATFIRADLTTAMNHFNKKTIQPKTQT
jgi:PTH1 family peptidyl-tRNA hydrolase